MPIYIVFFTYHFLNASVGNQCEGNCPNSIGSYEQNTSRR